MKDAFLKFLKFEKRLSIHTIKSYSIDLNQFIGKADLEAVRKAKKTLGDPDKLKPYFEHFEEAIPYNAIKIALKIIENEQ